MTAAARRSVRRFGVPAFLAVVVCALAACGKQEPAATTTAAAIAPPPESHVYSVGTDAAYAPFESQNEKGEIVGFDIDIVRAAAEKAGLEVKFVNTPWEGIFNALKQGDRDLLVSSITITDERKQSMDFSEPYFDAHQLIAVKADSKVAHFADLKTLKRRRADRHHRRRGGLQAAGQEQHRHQALRVDAAGAEGARSRRHRCRRRRQWRRRQLRQEQRGSKFKTVDDAAFVPEHYGIAVRKGDADLLGKIDQGLAAIQADGTYDRIYANYLGAPRRRGDAASK